jgi:hypothetical protein
VHNGDIAASNAPENTMLNAYIAQRTPRNRAPYFVISFYVQKEYGLGVDHVKDVRTGEDAEFATKDAARAVLRSMKKPAKRIAN